MNRPRHQSEPSPVYLPSGGRWPGRSPGFATSFVLGCLLTCSAIPVRAELSEKTRAEITAAFPRFTLPPAKPLPIGAANAPAPLSDDPLQILPDFDVREKRLPAKDSELWLNRRALKEKAMFEYHASMNELEWALNWWHIPLPFGYSLTPSAQARADSIHAEKKFRTDYKQLSSMVAAVAALDSADAKKLLRDLDLDGHPGK